MEENLVGHGILKSKVLLKAQILIRTKILKCPSKKLVLSNSSKEELQKILTDLFDVPVAQGLEDLEQLITQPDTDLIGSSFVQKWSDQGCTKWYGGRVECIQRNKFNKNEYRLCYEDNSFCFLDKEEIIADVIRGDFDIC